MRSDAFITVTCDRCWQAEEVGLTATARGYDERNMDAELENMGWKVIDGEDICPNCVEEMEAEKDKET